MTSLVLTVIGPDRPGLVESLAQTVVAHGGNWLESRMAHLSGQFAGILRVQVDETSADKLTNALRNLDLQGLTIVVAEDVNQPVESTPVRVEPLSMELVGSDRPGIVKQITSVLAEKQVNVEQFQTECINAPMSGKTLFRATARLHLPPQLSAEQLCRTLEEVAHDLMVDITFGTDDATQ